MKEKCSIVQMFDCLKACKVGALCLMAVASLGNALGAEPLPLEQKTIIQETEFDSRTEVPYPIAPTNVEYLVEKKWVMREGAFCTVVTVKQPEYVAPAEPLFEDIGYQFEGYFGLFTTDTGVVECKVFDKDGKPAQFIYPGEFKAFSPTSNLYAEWWQTPFGKEKVLYFLARLINEARAGGNDGAQRQVEKYSEEIKANPEKWELYVYRAFARFVTLWDDTYVKKFAESCGLDVVNPVLNFAKRGEVRRPDGKIIEPTTPLSLFIQQIETNKNIDQVCGSALPIIESAIADLDKIPDTWSGSVDITAANTGYPFDKHKTYCLDYADAQMIKAMFRGVMSFLELARGYNQYSAGVEPDGVNREALAEARKYYLMAVEMLSGFNAAHSRRTDLNDHLFMLVPYESRVLKSYEQAFFDLPWWTAEVDLGPFAEMCFTKQLKPHMSYKQWKNPEEEINRKRDLMRGKRLYVSLRSLFNGEVSHAKGTFPQLINNSVMLAREYGLTDPTLAGTFPELTRKGLGEYISIFDTKMYAYEQEYDIKYHAVVYTLPEGAKNNSENPNVYMTEDTPIVLKDPTFEGHKFTGWSNGDGSEGGVIPAESVGPMKFTAMFVPQPKVEYVTANGTVSECTDAVVVTEDTATFEDGQWYVVTGAVERSSITVNGAAHLILCDGAKLTATAVTNEAGIVVAAGNALTIYGQKLGTGELVAKNKWVSGGQGLAGACIGGVMDKGCGTITINGGTITAKSEGWSAGIGGAWGGSCGTVTINGGKVVAFGGAAAGIGDGGYGRDGKVTINGGTVDASHYQAYASADIGVGWHGSGTTVTINGGNVKAGTIQNAPTNSANAAVYCVTMEGLEGLVSLEGLEGYGTRDVYPIDGKVYLYLPNGTYYFKANDQWYKAVVKDAATVAEAHSPAAVKVISAKQRWPWNGKIDVVSSVVRLDAAKCYQLIIDLTLGETTKRVSCELGAGKDATYTNTVDCAALFGENVVGEVSVNVSLVVTDVGETVDNDDSYMVAVDTRKVKEITGSAGSVTVDLTYSGNNWGETAGGGAAIAAAFEGGEAKPLATGLTGEGTVPWKPESYGVYDLTHTADGITETAIFKFLRSHGIILILRSL